MYCICCFAQVFYVIIIVIFIVIKFCIKLFFLFSIIEFNFDIIFVVFFYIIIVIIFNIRAHTNIIQFSNLKNFSFIIDHIHTGNVKCFSVYRKHSHRNRLCRGNNLLHGAPANALKENVIKIYIFRRFVFINNEQNLILPDIRIPWWQMLVELHC